MLAINLTGESMYKAGEEVEVLTYNAIEIGVISVVYDSTYVVDLHRDRALPDNHLMSVQAIDIRDKAKDEYGHHWNFITRRTQSQEIINSHKEMKEFMEKNTKELKKIVKLLTKPNNKESDE